MSDTIWYLSFSDLLHLVWQSLDPSMLLQMALFHFFVWPVFHCIYVRVCAYIKKGNAKECSNYCTIALISHTSKVMLKIFQAKLQQYMNCEPPDVQAGFRKGRGTRDQIANIRWIIENSRKTSALLTTPKPLTVWTTTNSGKFLKRWKYQTTWSASWKICMEVRKQQLELDMEQQTASK